MSEHTPGPWTVEDPLGPETLWIVEDGKETYEWRCIAMVCRDDPPNSGGEETDKPILAHEQAANARLIAAAPELLAALHEMTREYRFEMGNDHQKAAWTLARTVIAKAEGRPT